MRPSATSSDVASLITADRKHLLAVPQSGPDQLPPVRTAADDAALHHRARAPALDTTFPTASAAVRCWKTLASSELTGQKKNRIYSPRHAGFRPHVYVLCRWAGWWSSAMASATAALLDADGNRTTIADGRLVTFGGVQSENLLQIPIAGQAFYEGTNPYGTLFGSWPAFLSGSDMGNTGAAGGSGDRSCRGRRAGTFDEHGPSLERTPMICSTANAARATCWRWVVLVLLGAVAACSNAPRYSNRPETEAERQARWAAAPWPPQPIRGSNPAEPRENLPYFWPYPDAPALRWPQPHPDAKPERGMSRFEYFNKLCTLEGGEFIYRTVKDVPGYYVIRPRVTSSVAPPGRSGTDLLLRTKIYAIEDPYGDLFDFWTLPSSFLSNLASPMQGGYDYIELPRIRWSDVPHWDYYLLGKMPPKDPLVVESRAVLAQARHRRPASAQCQVVSEGHHGQGRRYGPVCAVRAPGCRCGGRGLGPQVPQGEHGGP
jgi:hypothetical protein